MLGSDLVAKAKPDGYTLLAAGVPIAFNTALGRKLPYDALRDFTPLSLVVSQPLLIVVNPAVPVKSMAELVAYAKAQGKPLQYTTGGIGSYGHLWWEMFRSRQQIDGEHIAYNGIAPALKDVMGGQVPLLIDAIVPSGAQVQAGTVRGIAIVAAAAREVAAEPADAVRAGLHRLRRRAVLRRAGPRRHGRRGRAASSTRRSRRRSRHRRCATSCRTLGFDVIGSTPDAYAKLIRDEIDRWSKVVKRAEHQGGVSEAGEAQPSKARRARRRATDGDRQRRSCALHAARTRRSRVSEAGEAQPSQGAQRASPRDRRATDNAEAYVFTLRCTRRSRVSEAARRSRARPEGRVAERPTATDNADARSRYGRGGRE